MKRPNGSGSVYWNESRKRYIAVVQVYDPERRTMNRSFIRKKDALAALNEMREELMRGGTKKKPATIGGLWNEYQPQLEKLSSSKQTAYKIAFKRISNIERAFIAELSVSDLQSEIEGLSYYPARDIKILLSHLYQLAMAEQIVTANLSQFIVLPDHEEQEAVPFSEDEVKTIWNAYNSGDMLSGQILLMIYSGMMPGELCGAKKDQIDWEYNRIVGAGLKTKERRSKNILLPDIVMPVLKAVCDSHNKPSIISTNREHWYELYHATLIRIGVRDLPPYSCRHTTATALALGDAANPLLITRIMRQSRPMTTERYKHADEKAVLEALNKLK